MQHRLTPEAAPSWLRPLIDNIGQVSSVYRRGLSAEVHAMLSGREAAALVRGVREAAVLVLFCGPDSASGAPPAEADLLMTVRAAGLHNHAGQAAFPGGASDFGDAGPVETALREAHEETGIDVDQLHPLATLERTFAGLSDFYIVPVVAYSPDPGRVAVVNEAETAIVARVPVRAFADPANRLMVYRDDLQRRLAVPAFMLNNMLVWGFTAQLISAMLDVAGWAQPWDTIEMLELDEAMFATQ